MARAMLDSLGWGYISFAIVWSATLASALIFLHLHRDLPCLQIRRLPLVFAAIISLHLYGVACVLGYVLGPLAPCTAEFWIMSLYVPFGYAMFHAANSQFLHVASRQKRLARVGSLAPRQALDVDEADRLANSRVKRIVKGVERADKIDRMMVFIGIGLVIQLILVLFVFFASKKFHHGYGLFDYEVVGTQMEVRMKCSKGWEWWFSLVWQFFWSWIYAPYMLWKSRGIRDVHGWRTQTILCCLAGLPATPLWLSGLYLPQMAPVNMYFPPPNWFTISILAIEIITIGFPIIQVFRTKALRQKTLDAMASWEQRQRLEDNSGTTLADSDAQSSKSEIYSAPSEKSIPMIPNKSSFDSQRSDLFTMAALESALGTNPEHLLEFAALKDFSGESVSFLIHVAEWKSRWHNPTSTPEERRRRLFVAAVRIYVFFVSLDWSEFPINICFREMKRLQDVFDGAASILVRSKSVSEGSVASSATPFESASADDSYSGDFKGAIDLHELARLDMKSFPQVTDLGEEDDLVDLHVPANFTAGVFDAAEKEIKYLVLTNTWSKFVNAGSPMRVVEESSAGVSSMAWRQKVLCGA